MKKNNFIMALILLCTSTQMLPLDQGEFAAPFDPHFSPQKKIAPPLQAGQKRKNKTEKLAKLANKKAKKALEQKPEASPVSKVSPLNNVAPAEQSFSYSNSRVQLAATSLYITCPCGRAYTTNKQFKIHSKKCEKAKNAATLATHQSTNLPIACEPQSPDAPKEPEPVQQQAFPTPVLPPQEMQLVQAQLLNNATSAMQQFIFAHNTTALFAQLAVASMAYTMSQAQPTVLPDAAAPAVPSVTAIPAQPVDETALQPQDDFDPNSFFA